MTVDQRAEHVLPQARTIDLAERGSTTVWDSATTEWSSPYETERPPVVMLHGWNVDARLNFESAFAALADSGRALMLDHHGHGAGVRSEDSFDLDACALDVLAVLDALEVERAIIIGYSLGGAIAQVLGRRMPDRCAGLVLAATADRYAERRREHAQFSGLEVSVRAFRRLSPSLRQTAFERISSVACRRYPSWVLDTVRAADPLTLLEAGAALGRFDSTSWSGSIAAPSAVVVTANDTVVPPLRQRRLAHSLGTKHVFEIDADHDIPIRNDDRFANALVAAVAAVAAH